MYVNNRKHKRAETLWRKYGLLESEFEYILKYHGNKCSICCIEMTTVHNVANTMCIDHDHKTGKVRGLLCSKCNRGIGLLNDSPVLLRQAADYLEGSLNGPI